MIPGFDLAKPGKWAWLQVGVDNGDIQKIDVIANQNQRTSAWHARQLRRINVASRCVSPLIVRLTAQPVKVTVHPPRMTELRFRFGAALVPASTVFLRRRVSRRQYEPAKHLRAR